MNYDKWKSSAQQWLGEYINRFARRFPRFYVMWMMPVALMGYAGILLFPSLVVVGVWHLLSALLAFQNPGWIEILAWFLLTMISGFISLRIFQFKPMKAPDYPRGYKLNKRAYKDFVLMIRELRYEYKAPRMHRIIITNNFELNIIKTPKWGLPVWSTNSLVIGAPVLQILSPKMFRCALARRLGQFSKRDNKLTNWLYQLRDIWPQYQMAYARQEGIGVQPLCWFFRFYTSMYNMLSIHAARMDELAADHYTMEYFDDVETQEMMCTMTVAMNYLDSRYWPALKKMLCDDESSHLFPQSRLLQVWYAWLARQEYPAWLGSACSSSSMYNDPMPSLMLRLENIGHCRGQVAVFENITAAEQYMNSTIREIISRLDKIWLRETLIEIRQHRNTVRRYLQQPLYLRLWQKLRQHTVYRWGWSTTLEPFDSDTI